MKFNLIFAVCKIDECDEYLFSRDNDIPWNCKDDLKHFYNLTKGNIILMGSKTYESLKMPNGFTNRFNIVLTSNTNKYSHIVNDNIIFLDSLDKSLCFINNQSILNTFSRFESIHNETFIIGGLNLFNQILYEKKYLNLINNVYQSIIINTFENKHYDNNQYIPKDWKLILNKQFFIKVKNNYDNFRVIKYLN